MRIHRLILEALRDERGVALPMALLALLILSTLVISFSLLATSEPLIATNQKMVAQARAVAESGLERAIWALNNPANLNGIPEPLPSPAPTPFDGSVGIPISGNGAQIGLALVTVTNCAGCGSNERKIEAVGWVPTNTGTTAKAHQKIEAKVYKFLYRGVPPPASLTVKGAINVSGNTNVDSRSDTTCGAKDGTWSKDATTSGGSADVFGADGNNTKNQVDTGAPGPITDIRQNVPDALFDQYLLKSADLNSLKAIAKANGTYYSGSSVSGLTFNSSNKLKNGIVFIDTVSGNNIDDNGVTTPLSDFASVDIHGGAEADSSGIFSGMIVVAGTLSIAGNFHMHGLVYVVNDLTYTGTGTGEIDGAVITQNIRDTSSTTIDTNTGGNASVIFNCRYATTAGGQMPLGFTIEPGTYKEVADY